MIPTKTIFRIIAIAVVLGFGTLTYQHLANRGIPQELKDSIAVLKATKKADSLAHAQLQDRAESASVRSVVHSASSRTTQQHAQTLHQTADAAAHHASISTTARDSATYWHDAYLFEQKRGDSLDVALAQEKLATADARDDAILSKQADAMSQARLKRVDDLNKSITAELARSTSGCHILPFVRCPTRKEAIVLGAAITYGGLRYTNRLK